MNSKLKSSTNTKPDPVDLAAQFREEVIQKKPSLDHMKTEIQMNALKIRPFVGDVFHLNMSNRQFIEALWSILKLEEYVEKSSRSLASKDAIVFYNLMKQYKNKFQEQINRIDMRLPHIKQQGLENPITIEIFRDIKSLRQKRRIQ